MAHQALKTTLLRKTQQGDELKPGNVWVVTLKREIIQVPKEVYQKNKDKFHDGGFFNKGQAMMYKENKKMKKLTEAALKQLVMWWEGLAQPDKEKIANSSNRPQMAKLPIDKWQERDLEALITYAGKNNVLFEIATVLRLERNNLNDKNKVNSVKENTSMFSKEQIKLVDDVSSWCQENDKQLDKQLDRIYVHAEDTGNTDSGWKSVAEGRPELFAQALALALQHKDRLKEGAGMEWSSDAESWMDQAYDQLDDKSYLIKGAMNKFKLDKPSAINVYNKVARTRDPLNYAGSLTEMATIKDTWNTISPFAKRKLLYQLQIKNFDQNKTLDDFIDLSFDKLPEKIKKSLEDLMNAKTKSIKEVKRIVKEWMGGMSGIPNINSECEKCGMPSNSCECQLENDKKNNEKAELPKGLKFMTDDSTNMTIKKGLKESVVDVVKYKE